MSKMQNCDTVALSLFLHAQLENVGFNKNRVRQRVESYNKRSSALSSATRKILKADHIEKIVVGSRGEGLALENSDTDILQINHGILCKENLHDFIIAKEKRVLFKMEYQKTPPGYVFLRLQSDDECNPVFYHSVEYALVFSKRYLSSDKFVKKNEDLFFRQKGYIAENTKYFEKKGPSIPKKVFNTNDIDFVRAFPAKCNSVIRKWLMRSRQFYWPSREVQTEITSLPVYVVPVGMLDSEHRDLQWRVSFTPAEIHLVHSLNDTQTKLLVCLRLLSKHIFSPICSTMSSYLMKNVVFWLSEQNPIHNFDEHCLFDRLIDALVYIQNGIRSRYIPNYMVMERNLLERKLLDRCVQLDLDKAITDVMEQLPDTLLTCMRNYHDKNALQVLFPNLYSVAGSLKTLEKHENQSIKTIQAMTNNDLTNLTVGYFKSSNVLLVLWFDLRYIVLPYISQYGWKSMLFDFFFEKFNRIIWNKTTATSLPCLNERSCRQPVLLNFFYKRLQVGPSLINERKYLRMANAMQNERLRENVQNLYDESESVVKQPLYEIVSRRPNDRPTQESNHRLSIDYKIVPLWWKPPSRVFPDCISGTLQSCSRNLSENSPTKRKTHTITETITIAEGGAKQIFSKAIMIWIFSVLSKFVITFFLLLSFYMSLF